jgi:hypothetical protein
MTILSTTMAHPSISSDVLCKTTTLEAANAASSPVFPILREDDVTSSLANSIGLTSLSSSNGSCYTLAIELLKNSAHIPNTLGSPGTLMIIPQSLGKNDHQYEAIVVNRQGEPSVYNLKRFVSGWMIGNQTTVYKTFADVTTQLLSGMEDLIGNSHGIPFFTSSQIQAVLLKLSQKEPGTYVVFSHEPLKEHVIDGLNVSAMKRNIIAWVNQEGNLEHAHFHFDPSKIFWLNGGPQLSQETEVLKDKTLQGLIEAKIENSLQKKGWAKALKLDA